MKDNLVIRTKKKSKAKKKKKKKKSKAKKKKKKKKSKAKKKNDTNLEKKKKSKSKSKLRNESKAQRYPYNRYLDKLESKRAKGTYRYKYRFGGQVSYEVAYVNEADQSYINNDYRRVRFFYRGSFFNEKLFYEFEYDMVDNNNFKDNFIGYQDKVLGIKYRIKTGNIMIPFSLERYTSSKNNMFMERSLTNAFSQGRQLGVEVLLHKKFTKSNSANIFVSVFTSSIDERLNEDIIKEGYTLRATYAYKWRKNHLISVGGGYLSQNINNDRVRFDETAESFLMKDEYISVSMRNAQTLARNNLELLYINDKYSFQGEYTKACVDAINRSDIGNSTSYQFNGYYLEGSYFLIGQGRRYNTSASRMKKPSLNREGAIELALRYSHIDLDDEDEDNNGAQSNYTFGVNWYINDEMKLMVNYIIAEPQETRLYDGRLHILQTRMLFAF